jgi:hypothetical protein
VQVLYWLDVDSGFHISVLLLLYPSPGISQSYRESEENKIARYWMRLDMAEFLVKRLLLGFSCVGMND